MSERFGPNDCPACRGKISCHGGGNLACVQRDPVRSRIGGILDSYGGVRVVVTKIRSFKHHVQDGEFLCLVHNKFVHEPIGWQDVAHVIRLGELAVEKFIKDNEKSNDPGKCQAIHAWRMRQLVNLERIGSLDLKAIAYT